MAYLIFSTDGQEWDRRQLAVPVVLGRSADCEISVHDILLSRRHCRFTPTKDGWLVIDLASRNGTIVGDHAIDERKLKTGDVIRVGKTRVTFRAEAFVAPRAKPIRPAVPPLISRNDDTMAGTVFDLEFDEPLVPIRPPKSSRQPTPKPRPKDPESFETDDLYSMLEQIASSSWDSIYAVNAQPLCKTRLMPQPMIAGHPKLRPARPLVSLALQAESRVESPESMPDRFVTKPIVAMAPNATRHTRRRFAGLTRWITRVGTLRLF